MVSTSNITRSENTYELILQHSDIRAMMNDPEVLLQGGNVSETQEFAVILRQSNGAELILKDMSPTDSLIFRFKAVSILSSPSPPYTIDVINV